MICFFNRRELLLTYDLREINRVREILLANKIDYQVKSPRFPAGADRSRVTSFRRQEQYILYVHKADWEYGVYLLRNNL